MLVLCSNGLSSKALTNALQEKFSACKNAALVVTADHEYKENNYHVQRCSQELESLGLHVELFDIDKRRPEDLRIYDVVEFIGGNPFYLLNAINTHKAADVIKEIAAEKALIGWSAAAFVFGPSLQLVNQYSPEMNFLGLTDLTGLGLTDLEVLPHYSKLHVKFDNFEDKCKSYELAYGVEVIRLNDGDGVLIDHNNSQLIRAKSL